ncbi:MBOAT, membrane-bound O-acyltransferase family-domain-containing protein [Dipodascopsis tothii]|uniref:MBOAT, membrane-bound O-acyltransferase family-domain-containing protein n=1 Tax=Dipodascopsis tothii TaxID=44089 RepID=UPI0034CFD79D
MIAALDKALQGTADQLGMDVDPLKLMVTLFASYPLCGLMKRLPDDRPVLKKLFCLSVSAFYLLGVFDLGEGVRTLLVCSMGAYAAAKYVRSPWMPWAVFVVSMLHLMANHLYHAWYVNPDGKMDITGAHMVLVMKTTAFAWNVADGRRPERELSALQRDRALRALPPVLDYLTYVFFFPSLLIGPSFDFAEFARWLDLSMFDEPARTRGGKPRRRIPRSGRVATLKAAEGVLYVALWVALTPTFSAEAVLGDGFMTHNVVYRIFFLWPLNIVYRLKYYGAWSLAEGACILSGLGYNGRDDKGRARWDRVRNIDPVRFETGQNTFTLLEKWNMNTNKWLKSYVYLRVTPAGRKPGFRSTMATFCASAFWHGIHPGYYLTFVTGAFMQTCGKYSRRYIRPFFLTPDLSGPGPYKRYFDFVSWVAVQLGIAYTVQPFVILGFYDSMRLWARVWFYGHVVLFSMMIVFSTGVRKTIEGRLRERSKTASKLDQIKYEAEQSRMRAGHSPALGIPDTDLDELREGVEEDMRELRKDIETLRARSRRTQSKIASA